jgi:hypothetical protein
MTGIRQKLDGLYHVYPVFLDILFVRLPPTPEPREGLR